MTVSTEAWYTGYHPYTLEPIYSAKTPKEKLAQRQFFFWYKPEERRGIEQELRKIGRADLIQQLFDKTPAPKFNNPRKPSDQRNKANEKKSYNPNFAPKSNKKEGRRKRSR